MADIYGDGSDGAYTGGPLVKGQTYNFTTFDLSTPVVLGAGDGNKIHIMCTGALNWAVGGTITSNLDAVTKDSAPLDIGGVSVSCTSIDGEDGFWGVGGEIGRAHV